MTDSIILRGIRSENTIRIGNGDLCLIGRDRESERAHFSSNDEDDEATEASKRRRDTKSSAARSKESYQDLVKGAENVAKTTRLVKRRSITIFPGARQSAHTYASQFGDEWGR